MSVRIQVPATTANLGPGFDILGMALQFYNRFEAKVADELSVSVLPGTCVDVTYLNLDPARNIVARAYRTFFEKTGCDFLPAHLGIEAHIPLARGLGSSSTAIVAGLILANEISEYDCSLAELLAMAVELEGHPDNVTPAIMGGVCCSLPGKPLLQLNWPSDWGLIFIIPPTSMSTKKARAVLPAQYDESVMSHQRVMLEQWVKALEAHNTQAFSQALTSDQLHEPYRKPLIPEWAIVDEVLKETDALGCVLSGAGSTLLVITPSSESTVLLQKSLLDNPRLAHCKIMRLKPDCVGACLI